MWLLVWETAVRRSLEFAADLAPHMVRHTKGYNKHQNALRDVNVQCGSVLQASTTANMEIFTHDTGFTSSYVMPVTFWITYTTLPWATDDVIKVSRLCR